MKNKEINIATKERKDVSTFVIDREDFPSIGNLQYSYLMRTDSPILAGSATVTEKSIIIKKRDIDDDHKTMISDVWRNVHTTSWLWQWDVSDLKKIITNLFSVENIELDLVIIGEKVGNYHQKITFLEAENEA